jgi:putative Mg2+ transporter-C (MgtC) family protein
MTQFFAQNSEVLVRLGIALVLGMVIGIERILVHREPGMKTHALVSMGSALFIIVSEIVAIKYKGIADFDPTRIASQIIVGIGFLGAGSILVKDSRVLGLTTASGLWVTAGIGMAAGFGLTGIAITATLLVLIIFIVLNLIEKPIRRISDNMHNGE